MAAPRRHRAHPSVSEAETAHDARLLQVYPHLLAVRGRSRGADTAPYSAACLRFGAFCGAIRFPAVTMTPCRKSGKRISFDPGRIWSTTMMSIFNFFGSVLGYLLLVPVHRFQNYGIAIILFTIIVKALMFPFSIKSQKSMRRSPDWQASSRSCRRSTPRTR